MIARLLALVLIQIAIGTVAVLWLMKSIPTERSTPAGERVLCWHYDAAWPWEVQEADQHRCVAISDTYSSDGSWSR